MFKRARVPSEWTNSLSFICEKVGLAETSQLQGKIYSVTMVTQSLSGFLPCVTDWWCTEVNTETSLEIEARPKSRCWYQQNRFKESNI